MRAAAEVQATRQHAQRAGTSAPSTPPPLSGEREQVRAFLVGCPCLPSPTLLRRRTCITTRHLAASWPTRRVRAMPAPADLATHGLGTPVRRHNTDASTSLLPPLLSAWPRGEGSSCVRPTLAPRAIARCRALLAATQWRRWRRRTRAFRAAAQRRLSALRGCARGPQVAAERAQLCDATRATTQRRLSVLCVAVRAARRWRRSGRSCAPPRAPSSSTPRPTLAPAWPPWAGSCGTSASRRRRRRWRS